jgi:cytochrome P450
LTAEVDEVLGDRQPELDDYQRLEYTRAVLQESMRLYPPAWFVDREAIADDEIGGYAIAAGSTVSVSPYFVHRHPDFWTDPERFDPDRFLRRDDATKNAYIPFGSGRRGCIASGFAMLEGVLALASISRRYVLKLVPDHPVTTRAEVTLRPRYGMPMFVRRRTV